MGYLKSALAHAVRMGQLAANPMTGLRCLPRGRKDQRRPARALSDWELTRLLRAAQELDEIDRAKWTKARRPGSPLPRFPFVLGLALTGARFSELAKATWTDFDADASSLTLRGETTKNGHARTIPVVPELAATIAALPALYRAHGVRVSSASPIFLGSTGKSYLDAEALLHRWLRRAYELAEIPIKDELGRVVHIHALRHTFATRLARSGVPLAVAQKLTGHRSLAILLQVYTHLRDDESRKAIEGLPSLGVVGIVEPTSDESARARSSASGS